MTKFHLIHIYIYITLTHSLSPALSIFSRIHTVILSYSLFIYHSTSLSFLSLMSLHPIHFLSLTLHLSISLSYSLSLFIPISLIYIISLSFSLPYSLSSYFSLFVSLSYSLFISHYLSHSPFLSHFYPIFHSTSISVSF